MKFIFSSLLLATSLIVSAQKPEPMKDVNQVIDNTPDSINIARTARPVAGSTRKGDNPVLFLVGNSTMRTGTMGNGNNGQWGWGYFMHEYFDPEKISVENQALGGMSSRTFYNVLWPDVVKGIRPGDWVIIELGHNDNGPFDEGRARATIKGIGNDSLPVVIKETGRKETVYTYGEYMRRYVREVKAKGGHPILMSLTPRNAWEDKDSTIVTRVNKTFGLWAKQVAEAEGVPFIDLNDITATKFERFGKEKVKTMFYLDRIHTSQFGARVNVESAVEGIRNYPGLGLAQYLLPAVVDKETGSSRKPGRPVLFTIGDSTVKNKDNDPDGMWGWGSVINEMFDTTRISVENHAMAGRSARTFLDEGRWDKVYNALQPGDYVIMQFGHNDGGDINTGKARGELHGSGDESKVFLMEKTGKYQVVYTFGWYIRKFIMDAREKGAIPIVLSHTPRNKWKDGKIESNADSYGKWSREAAKRGGAYYINLNEITGKKYQAMGPEAVKPYYNNDHTHSSLLGARTNAASITEGLRYTDCPLKQYLKPVSVTVNPDDKGGKEPFFVSFDVPDGNYKVTVKLGNKKRAGVTTVRGESRRLFLDRVATKKGKFEERSFIINKRNRCITPGDSVNTKKREATKLNWDDKLTLEFNGPAPAVESITVEEAPADITTVFLCGNSTVVDQDNEPWASWGQIIPHYFDNSVAVANYAESGESANTFIAAKRLAKALSQMKKGDYVFIEFGHNDQKQKGPGKGAYYSFATSLKTFVDEVRARGAQPVFVTPTCRRSFDESGHIRQTHEDYPDAMRWVAEREKVPVIELNPMTKTLYEALGVENSKKAFVHYPKGTYPGQDRELADNTHFNPYGATQVAKCVLTGISKILPDLAKHIVGLGVYDPATPDDPATFVWDDAPNTEIEKPDGN